MEFRKYNQGGFTFFSNLISITLICMTLPFIVYLIKSVPSTSAYDELSVQHFFYYLRDELALASNYVVEEDKIKLSIRNDREALIEKYGTLIRRRVNNQGHEIYLRDVHNVTFHKLDYGLRVKLITLQGEHYEKDIIFYE